MAMNNFKIDSEPKIQSGFKTPDRFFDDFSSKIMEQLPVNEPKVISFYAKRKNWILAVAAIIVLALTVPIINKFNTPSAELDVTTLENYLTNRASISDDDLVELLDEEDIQKMKVDYKIEDKAIEDLLSTNSNLEEYIIY
ncbi:hypothetical protein [Flavobacterium psychrotolerans]|uniref:Uncharacterized protein n=1 Tax=Flavobacterium psychrotolerans TaxID=2169410 RepID=A0A2U1JR70_9FLAO|nr:hypothetical protein [Flavobacterium psychrotolerans]PWA07383.1 hypothetical protein DB895_01295 [Flavobacterium psychrotolerans]